MKVYLVVLRGELYTMEEIDITELNKRRLNEHIKYFYLDSAAALDKAYELNSI